MAVQAVRQQGASVSQARAIRGTIIQDVNAALFGWGFYLTIAAVLALGVLRMYTTIHVVTGNGVHIISHPFDSTVFCSIAFGLVYVTVGAARSITRSRERDRFGALGLIGAHLAAGVVVYVLLALLYAPLLWLLARLSNLHLPPHLLWTLILSIPLSGVAVSFGLFLATVSGSSRSAMVLLGAATIIVVVIQGGHAASLIVPPADDGYDELLIPLRAALRMLDMTLAWVSPFGMLRDLLDAALRVDYAMAAGVLARAFAGMVVWTVLGIGALRRYDGGDMRRLVPGLPLMILLVALLVTPGAHAQAPARTEAFAYGVNAATPDGSVIGTLVPPAVDTVYLLADRTNVVSPRRTEIYFWPLTNRYRTFTTGHFSRNLK